MIEKTTPCQCSGGGFCSHFGRKMHEAFFEQCATNPAAYNVFLQESRQGKYAAERARHESLNADCKHRLTQVDLIVCEHCGANKGKEFAVYGCELRGKCTDNFLKADMQACSYCDDYEARQDTPTCRLLESPRLQIAIGVTTAPRKHSYLPHTLRSMQATGFSADSITVFAEPDSDLAGVPSSIVIEQRVKKLGIYHNWRTMLGQLVERNPTADVIMTAQDDIEFASDVRAWLDSVLWPTADTGCVSLYTAKHYSSADYGIDAHGNKVVRTANIKERLRAMSKDLKIVHCLHDPGFIRSSEISFWGACCLVFPRRVAERILHSKYARDWLGIGAPKQAMGKSDPSTITAQDAAVGRIIERLGLEMYVTIPSPVRHTAKFSTHSRASNTGKHNTATFPGVAYSMYENCCWREGISI